MLLRPQVIRVQQRPFQEKPAQRVADPNDRIPARALVFAEQCQGSDERLRMLVDEVIAGASVRSSRVDVGVVAIDENVGRCSTQRSG